MSADVSRVRFDSRLDFAGVVLQQGRVLLDADFNEYVALLDRRLRAETCDLASFGPDPAHAGVAWVPRQTPDGFRVTAAGGALSIGRGRMYVDGLLAENHGLAPGAFDPLLAESTGTADTPYDQQPYWPTPDALPTGGPHLAFLDVWERQVTHLEDPGLVEIAIGVDTTARWQIAWQVRLLPDVGNATCASDDDEIPGWLNVITPSAGRLTTGTVEVAAADDPCKLTPAGGYRGLENQTYRVEVHDGGAPGTATFKWSRDNGSVVLAAVEMVSPSVLRLASLGRDDVLRVSTGDWIEILDDHYELGRRPGVMRKVTVDDAERTVAFADALPGDLQPAGADDAAARHLRVRRWDQSGVVRSGTGAQLVDLDAPGSTGLITVPSGATTQVVLESGVVVSFSLDPAGGTLHRGDHWIFAARTADASLEILDAAPPLGVPHHYARLGVVTFPGSQTDCRRLWPPIFTSDDGCECSVCVMPSGPITLQAAIDHVKATGGTVCLSAGVHDIGAGVTIDQARSLRIRGQGPATVVVARATAFTITNSAAVTLENMAVVSGAGASAAVRTRNVVSANLQDLVVLSYGSDGAGAAAVELAGIGVLVDVRRNVLVGRTGVRAGLGDKAGMLAAGLRVQDNVVVAPDRGIDLGGLSSYLYECKVTGNDIVGGGTGGLVATGAVAPGGSLDVSANRILASGPSVVVGADAVVDANILNAHPGGKSADGIVVTASPISVPPGHVRITGNRVHDRLGTAIALRTAVRTIMVKHNVMATVGAGFAVEGRGAAGHVAVANNELVDIATGSAGGSAVGIVVSRADSVAVVDNTVHRVGSRLVEGQVRAGVLVMASADVRITGNVIGEIGPREGFLGMAAGAVVVGPLHRLAAAENSIRYAEEDVAPQQGGWHAILIQSAGQGLVKLGAQKAVLALGSGAVVLNGLWAHLTPARGDHVTLAANTLTGGGPLPTCLVRIAGDVILDANQCLHLQPGEPVAILARASSAIAASNRVRGPKAMLVLEVAEDRFSAVGNLAAGGTHFGGPGAGLPAPWDALNPTVS